MDFSSGQVMLELSDLVQVRNSFIPATCALPYTSVLRNSMLETLLGVYL